MRLKTTEIAIILITALIVLVLLVTRSFYSGTFTGELVTILVIVGAIAPVMVYTIMKYNASKMKETQFPSLLMDIANNLEIGISLPDTMDLIRKNNYKNLTADVKKMYKQMSWGRNFADVFAEVCHDSGSVQIRKTGAEVLATINAGGELSKVLKGVSKSMQEYQEVLSERKSQMYEQIITGYMVFIVFVGIIFVLLTQLVPLIKTSPLGTPSATPEEYKTVLFQFSLIEAVCVAIITGKMSEGSITASFKHILILVTITVAIFSMVG